VRNFKKFCQNIHYFLNFGVILIFDSHAHYDDKVFDDDRAELLARLPEKNVSGVINVGSDLESSQKSIDLSGKYDFIYPAVGIHPQILDAAEKKYKIFENFILFLKNIIQENIYNKSNRVIAVGETGLDYSRGLENKEIQKLLFEEQAKLAEEFGLPLIVHARDSLEDVIKILEKFKISGVVHCFSGNLKVAARLIEMGFKIGVGGVITFKNAGKLINTIEKIPIEEILLETDAPYLSPVPVRGKRCNSTYIKYTGTKLAEIKKMRLEEIFKITKQNAIKLFNLRKK
jgi:TatD DNase family protein